MLTIYTDKSFVTEANRKIIFPLLFDLCYGFNANLLKKYVLVDSLEESEIVIVPIDIGFFYKNKQTDWLFDFIGAAQKAQKKVWVYSAGDFGITIPKEVYTFRLGGFHSKLDNKTFVLPSFINDPYSVFDKEFYSIAKQELPRIGFVGHANNSVFKWCTEYLVFVKQQFKRVSRIQFDDYQTFYPSSIKRFKYLKQLESNKNIETDFIYRNRYRAGSKDERDKVKTAQEFFENIYNSPYTFCLRGAGNFSVRFYEILAMGRIPVLINTDVRLPLDQDIDWTKHCAIVDEVNFMAQLIDFHQKISPSEFEIMQTNNRNLWLNTLNRESYFEKIHSIFKAIL